MLTIENLTFRYHRSMPMVLKGVNLTLQDGEIGILLGKNGAGKTSLFQNILGIRQPLAGAITFDGERIDSMSGRERARRIAYVPQHIHFGHLSVYDSILLGRIPYFGFQAGQDDFAVVERVMEEMQLTQYADHIAENLSGGEKQKIAIARAMVQEPKLMVFDEPTGNLDIANEHLIIREAKRLAREKQIAILSSLHDLNQAMEFGDRFFWMKDGVVRHTCNAEEITSELIEEIFDAKVKIVEIDGRKVILSV